MNLISFMLDPATNMFNRQSQATLCNMCNVFGVLLGAKNDQESLWNLEVI